MQTNTYNMEDLAQPFTFEPRAVSNKKVGMKEIGASSDDLWKIPVSKLRPIPGFNVRVKNAGYYMRRREYADSMKVEGYLAHKPMAGYVGVDPDTGETVFFLTAGYTRTDSIELANSELPEEKQIKFVTAVALAVKDPNDPKSKGLSQDDLNGLLIRENKGAAYNAYEASIVCKRMADNGNSINVIATKTGFSSEWVGNLLELAEAPIELQMMVADDVIKPTLAIEVIKEHGDKALAVLQAALARKIGIDATSAPASVQPAGNTWVDAHVSSKADVAAGSDTSSVVSDAPIDADASVKDDVPGDSDTAVASDAPAAAAKKVRLTAKDLVAPEVRKFNNKVQREAPTLYKVAKAISNDAAFKKLNRECREALLQVLAALQPYEVTDGPAVDPRQVGLFAEANGQESAQQNVADAAKAA